MKTFLIVTLLVGTVLAGLVYEEDKQVYTFGIGMESPPFEVISDSGDQMGFSMVIIRRVCNQAHKNCAFVTYNDYNTCWNSQTMDSQGLNNRYWDVCCTYYKTKERANVYSFFGEISAEQPAFLYARSDASFQTFIPAAHRIGFRKGFWLSETCLEQNHNMDIKYPEILNNWADMKSALRDNTIDVGFMVEDVVSATDNLKKVSTQFKCALTGNSMMVRKDSLAGFSWFEPVLKEVLKSDYYQWACNIAKMAHHADPFCFKNSKK